MKRVAALGVLALGVMGGVTWWFLSGDDRWTTVEPGTPLPLDEPVQMRWVDAETGESEVWTVTKRDTEPGEHTAPPALPEPDPDAGDHVPDESARTLHAMALESWKRGEIPEAMQQLERAIERDPDDPLLRTPYGRLQMLAMSYSQALPHLQRAAELEPDDPQAWLDLTTLYEKTRMLDRAWATRRRAEELADGRAIVQDPTSGFWVVEGNAIYP